MEELIDLYIPILFNLILVTASDTFSSIKGLNVVTFYYINKGKK